MKYCPYQTNEVDRIFHISPLQTFPLCRHNIFYQTYPQFSSPAHFSLFLHFMSGRMPLLCLRLCITGYRSSCRYVTGGDRSVTTPILSRVSAASLSHCPRCCGQWRYLVCSGHAEEHLLSSRFKLEISYLKKLNNEYMFAELCDRIILTKH